MEECQIGSELHKCAKIYFLKSSGFHQEALTCLSYQCVNKASTSTGARNQTRCVQPIEFKLELPNFLKDLHLKARSLFKASAGASGERLPNVSPILSPCCIFPFPPVLLAGDNRPLRRGPCPEFIAKGGRAYAVNKELACKWKREEEGGAGKARV